MAAPTVAERYPNLAALSHRCVSFPLDEWPMVKLEAGRLLAELGRIEEAYARLMRPGASRTPP